MVRKWMAAVMITALIAVAAGMTGCQNQGQEQTQNQEQGQDQNQGQDPTSQDPVDPGDDDDDLERATAVARQKWKSLQSKKDWSDIKKLQAAARFLAGRGFSPSVIRQVLDDLGKI